MPFPIEPVERAPNGGGSAISTASSIDPPKVSNDYPMINMIIHHFVMMRRMI